MAPRASTFALNSPASPLAVATSAPMASFGTIPAATSPSATGPSTQGALRITIDSASPIPPCA